MHFSITVLNGALALAFSVHANPILIAKSSAPPLGFNYYGCYTDSRNSRTLQGGRFNNDTMTVELCASYCGNNYQFIGVEYGAECYCGQSVLSPGASAPEADCSTPCGGNSAENCGNGDRLNIYQCPTCSFPTTTSTASSVPTASPYPGSMGCWTDVYPQNNGIRTLNAATLTSNNMTTEVCDAFCSGFTYFGTEYGRECYCDNNINTGAGSPTSSSQCTYQCANNANQICGGAQLINLYQHTPASSSSSSMGAGPTSTSSSSAAPTSSSSSSNLATPSTSTAAAPSTSSSSPSAAPTSSSTSSKATTTSSSSSSTTPAPSSSSSSSSAISKGPTTSSSSSLSGPSSSNTVKTTSTTSLSRSTSSIAATPTGPPATLATPLTNSYFQEDNLQFVTWAGQTNSASVVYDFQRRTDGTNVPNSGHQMGVITLSPTTTSNGLFSQPITIVPYRYYYFSGYSRHPVSADTGCVLQWILSTPQGNIIQILGQTSTSSSQWTQSTGMWYSGNYQNVVFNVRTQCSGAARANRIFYFDSIDFYIQ